MLPMRIDGFLTDVKTVTYERGRVRVLCMVFDN